MKGGQGTYNFSELVSLHEIWNVEQVGDTPRLDHFHCFPLFFFCCYTEKLELTSDLWIVSESWFGFLLCVKQTPLHGEPPALNLIGISELVRNSQFWQGCIFLSRATDSIRSLVYFQPSKQSNLFSITAKRNLNPSASWKLALNPMQHFILSVSRMAPRVKMSYVLCPDEIWGKRLLRQLKSNLFHLFQITLEHCIRIRVRASNCADSWQHPCCGAACALRHVASWSPCGYWRDQAVFHPFHFFHVPDSKHF